MKIFFDTNVLVAASERNHPQYGPARPALLRVARGQDVGYMSSHSIAEFYASLTRLPVQPRIHPLEAARIITENIVPYFKLVPVRKSDYLHAMNAVATAGWAGAKIYDALLLRCAETSGASRIYTFNLADFRQLAPANLRDKISAP